MAYRDLDTVPAHHLEDAVCFRCQQPGHERWSVDQFGLVECPGCGQSFASPRLNDAGRANLYAAAGYFDEGVYANRMATTLQRTWIKGRLDYLDTLRAPTGRMLEIGCAYGMFLQEAAARGYAIDGLEYSPTAATAASNHLGVPIAHGEIGDLDETHRADVVTAWDVIEHVSDPHAFAKSAYGLLNPGGTLLLSLPNFDALAVRVLGTRWWNLKLDRHIWHFRVEDLRRVLEEAGFRDIAILSSPLRRVNLGRIDSVFASAKRPDQS
ncbi:MAG: class I SAM-dependent methyltransferase [Acidimicrobiia bacterium]|nr:class I SAM-dependent methyltransferase [Acidimicrobiia bacterium]